jgi:hypothetical protein
MTGIERSIGSSLDQECQSSDERNVIILGRGFRILLCHGHKARNSLLRGTNDGIGMRRVAVFHIPRTAGKWVHEIVRVNNLENSVLWRGHNTVRQTQSHQMPLGRLALTVRDPMSWYQSQENFTKGMVEPNPMKLLSREGRDGLEGALERMQSDKELRLLNLSHPEVSFFKKALSPAPWDFMRNTGLGLWSWAIRHMLSVPHPTQWRAADVPVPLGKIFVIRQGSLLEDLQTLFARELYVPEEVGPERDDRSADYAQQQPGPLQGTFSFLEQEIQHWETIARYDQTHLAGKIALFPLAHRY